MADMLRDMELLLGLLLQPFAQAIVGLAVERESAVAVVIIQQPAEAFPPHFETEMIPVFDGMRIRKLLDERTETNASLAQCRCALTFAICFTDWHRDWLPWPSD